MTDWSTSWRRARPSPSTCSADRSATASSFDAVRVRLIEIGEAVKDVSPELLAQQPSIPWRQVAAMRDRLAHRSFDTSHAIVAQTVGADLVELLAATGSLLAVLDAQD